MLVLGFLIVKLAAMLAILSEHVSRILEYYTYDVTYTGVMVLFLLMPSLYLSLYLTLPPLDRPYGPMTNTGKENFSGG